VDATDLPPCGLYRTAAPIGSVPAGRLVYFHNHGQPGPGVYLPEGWSHNRARFRKEGITLPDPGAASALEPVAPEGLYRVKEPFTCCEKGCRTFGAGLLVQLGYDGSARPILFVPEWTERGLAFPQLGQGTDAARVAHLERLEVAVAKAAGGDAASDAGPSVH
jgi:hypothetical protein